jgi:hypothetical protein
VWISRRKQKEERETRTTTDERVNPEASQKGNRMMSRGMPEGGIRVTASPGQDGSTVNNEITGSNESSPDGLSNGEYEEGLVRRGSGGVATFAML